MAQNAIGLIETLGLTAAIEAADVAAKTADISIDGLTLIGGGYVAVRFHGELASCQAALESAREAAQKVGRVVASRVIPRPEAGLETLLARHEFSIGTRSTADLPVRNVEPKAASGTPRVPREPASPPRQPRKTESKPAPKPRPAPEKVSPPVDIKARPLSGAAPEKSGGEKSAEPATEKSPSSTASGQRFDMSALADMPVVKLRKFARNIDDLPIQGREISMANKQELLKAIESVNR